MKYEALNENGKSFGHVEADLPIKALEKLADEMDLLRIVTARSSNQFKELDPVFQRLKEYDESQVIRLKEISDDRN